MPRLAYHNHCFLWMPSSNIFHFIKKKIKKKNQSVKNWSLALSTFPTLPDASQTLSMMFGCGTVLPPCTQYLYSDFYCLEYQLCWKDRTAWKRSCSPPGTRSVKVEDQSRTHDTIAPRNKLQPLGEILTARIMGAQRVFDALLGLLIFLPWATGRSSTGIWSVYLVTVYRSPNVISWSTAQKDPSHFFHESRCISSARSSVSLTRPTRAGPCLLTPCCPPATSRAVWGTLWAAAVGRKEGRRVGEKVAASSHPTNACLRIDSSGLLN